MMNSTADEDEDFPPNPFRSGGVPPPPQQQQPMLVSTFSPQQQQQQQQQQQPPLMASQEQQQDFFTNPQSMSSDPLSTVSPAPMDSNNKGARPSVTVVTTNNNNINYQTQQQQGSLQSPAVAPPMSWWQACRACCTMQTYQQYFDIDTQDIKNRVRGVIHFYRPDYFRTQIIGAERNGELKGPDLYGPFWITMTLVFLLAVTSNLAAYIHSDNMEEFEYDISHLIRALSVLGTFAFVVPPLFWILTQCMSMQALYMVDWICLYGYSLLPYIPATLLCLIPVSVMVWISLAAATAVSAVLVLRNVAGPLLASDVSQTRSGPLLLAILGVHIIFLLTLKLVFYHH